MQILNKKLIAAALTFALALTFLGQPLAAAAGRRGSMVEVTMTDGRAFKGELLAVKGHDLIIHDKSTDRGFTVDIELVSEIRIKRKSRVLAGLVIGLVAGVFIGVPVAFSGTGGHSYKELQVAAIGLFIPCITTMIGGIAGGLRNRSKKISVKEQIPFQVEWSLRCLQKHARYLYSDPEQER